MRLIMRLIFLLRHNRSREMGIDESAGAWIRVKDDNWPCLVTPRAVGDALKAVEFLASD
jgi:hypothetical protein